MPRPKSQIETIPYRVVPAVVKVAYICFKNELKTSAGFPWTVYGNREESLPNPDNGCEFYEAQVGTANPNETRPEMQRGAWRLVIEVCVKPREIREVYLTDEHYARHSFRRVWPL